MNEQTITETIDVDGAALTAAMIVFRKRMEMAPPPQHVVEEALEAAGKVYDDAENAAVDKVLAETSLAGMEPVSDGFRIRYKHAHDLAAGMVASFDAFLQAKGAENYVEWESTVTDPDSDSVRKYTFIVTKPGGRTPHQLRQDAERERDELLIQNDFAARTINMLLDQLTAISDQTRTLPADPDAMEEILLDVGRHADRGLAQAIPYSTGFSDAENADLDKLLLEASQRGVELPAGIRIKPGPSFEDADRGGLARPPVVVLCGSTRFYDQFQQANYELTMAGKIVLSVGFYPHASAEHGHGEGVGHDSTEKVALDELHKRKIDLADQVHVLNVDGYIGESTRAEIAYAQATGKPITYLETRPTD